MFLFCPLNRQKIDEINSIETNESQFQPIDAHTRPCYPIYIHTMESVSPNRGRLELAQEIFMFLPPDRSIYRPVYRIEDEQ